MTTATSGVTDCAVSVPSMCNNSIPGPDGLSVGQGGYVVGPGYDEVTGLGSLDVENFIKSYVSKRPPILTIGLADPIGAFSATLRGTVNSEGINTNYWFLYGIHPSLYSPTWSAIQSTGGTSAPGSIRVRGTAGPRDQILLSPSGFAW